MDLVIDANILFSILIKRGKTEELLFEEDLHLFAPEFIFEEFEMSETATRNLTALALSKRAVSEHAQEHAPPFRAAVLDKYSDFLLAKTERTRKEFDELIITLKKRIKTIANEDTEKFILQAEKICPDKKDADYFALALKINCPVWSNDKVLKTKQDSIKVYSTEELIGILDR